jgi:hypothetical protein
MKIVAEAIVEKIESRSDRSIKVVISSQELDEVKAAQLFGLRNKFIKILFSDSNISPLEEAMIDELALHDGKKVKTQSQRLRNVLFRVHEQNGGDKTNFDEYYKERMEQFIEHEKSKLEP